MSGLQHGKGLEGDTDEKTSGLVDEEGFRCPAADGLHLSYLVKAHKDVSGKASVGLSIFQMTKALEEAKMDWKGIDIAGLVPPKAGCWILDGVTVNKHTCCLAWSQI